MIGLAQDGTQIGRRCSEGAKALSRQAGATRDGASSKARFALHKGLHNGSYDADASSPLTEAGRIVVKGRRLGKMRRL